jgi:hypothetical protein
MELRLPGPVCLSWYLSLVGDDFDPCPHDSCWAIMTEPDHEE